MTEAQYNKAKVKVTELNTQISEYELSERLKGKSCCICGEKATKEQFFWYYYGYFCEVHNSEYCLSSAGTVKLSDLRK